MRKRGGGEADHKQAPPERTGGGGGGGGTEGLAEKGGLQMQTPSLQWAISRRAVGYVEGVLASLGKKEESGEASVTMKHLTVAEIRTHRGRKAVRIRHGLTGRPGDDTRGILKGNQ